MTVAERAMEEGWAWAESASPEELERLSEFQINELSNDEVDQERVAYELTGDPTAGIYGDDDGRDRSSAWYLRNFVQGAAEAVAAC